MKVEARIPVRIDFGGPWTDCPEFYRNEESGGATFNAAIVPLIKNEWGEDVPAYVTGSFSSGNGFDEASAVQISGPSGKIERLLVCGPTVQYGATLKSSGLGTSGALNVIWLALVKAACGADVESKEARLAIAEGAHRIERHELGIVGGKQDQLAATFGGFRLYRFSVIARQDSINFQTLDLEQDLVEQLQKSLILYDSGKVRLSAGVHVPVWEAYENRQNREALVKMRDLAYQMFDVLPIGALTWFGHLLTQNWQCQKALHPSVTNEDIETTFAILQKVKGFFGGKACGAGGGGCLLFCVDPKERPKFEGILGQMHGTQIPFEFDFKGLQVEIRD